MEDLLLGRGSSHTDPVHGAVTLANSWSAVSEARPKSYFGALLIVVSTGGIP